MVPHADTLATLRERGFVQQVSDERALGRVLRAGPLAYYVGFDPSAPSLHLGNTVPLVAMAHLARAGHRPIVVLGGGTMMVGDPSGRTELRRMMTPEQIEANRKRIEPQARRFLEAAGDAVVVADNAEWLLPLNYVEFLRDIGVHFSVNRMLAAEAYKQRIEKGLSFIEFNYQLLQAYDYLVLYRRYGCRLQMGGDDQWGNILAGTDLIRRIERAEAFALTFPLVTTASGAKMGKTATGALWLDPAMTRPFDFYQYFVNVDDRDVGKFLALFTFLPMDEVRRLGALEGAELREAKDALAFEVTSVVHGRAEADAQRQAARAAFGGQGGGGVPEARVRLGDKVVDVLAASGLAVSKSAARRLVEQGGVHIGRRAVRDFDEPVRDGDLGQMLRAGKKHVRKLVE